MADLRWDDAALEDLLHSIDGPVGRFVKEKTAQMTTAAEAKAPIQKPKNYSWGRDSSSYLPRSLGYLKGTVRPVIGYTRGNQLFGGANAAFGPTLFLERGGGRHGHARLIPFMTESLYAAFID